VLELDQRLPDSQNFRNPIMDENNKEIAKQKAIVFLERSIETLSMIFGVDSQQLTSSSVNPYEESELPYTSYSCLLSEVKSLEKLKNVK